MPPPVCHSSALDGDTIEHLYVHIPFCARICPYCAFYKDLLDGKETKRFCQALLRELNLQAEVLSIQPSTIYFGGGTPTALTTDQLDFLLNGFRDVLDLSKLREWTVEANPGSVSARKAAILRSGGINRVSLGVQSWEDDLLKVLGREHDAAQAEKSFHLLRQAGFDNINLDLMFGLPGQTTAQWQATLERTASLGPEHISTYCLTYEEDTVFFSKFMTGEFRADEDLEAALFDLTRSYLQEQGYEQYEISNYAQPGFESVHNRAYWSGEDYLGIGPSAFSTVRWERRQNLCDYRSYSARVLGGDSALLSVEPLSPAMKKTERIALLLRTRTGVSADLLRDRRATVQEFVASGLLAPVGDRFVLTHSGRRLTDSVAAALI